VEDQERLGQPTHQLDMTKLPPRSQEGTTPPRMENHCLQPSARRWNKMMMMMMMVMMMVMTMYIKFVLFVGLMQR